MRRWKQKATFKRTSARFKRRLVISRKLDRLITDYHLNDGETGTQVIATLREVLSIPLKAVLTTGDTTRTRQAKCGSHLRQCEI